MISKLLRTSFVILAFTGLAACAPVAQTGATIETAGPDVPAGSNEDFIINVGRRIYFSENSADLDETARRTLDKQGDWLNTYRAYKIKIEGFADDPGTPEVNRSLGLRRANAVVSYLALKGIAATRMRAKSFGRERLAKSCPDISCTSQNRRVVTVLDTEVGS